MLALGKGMPVASGSNNDVYVHPGDPALLVKVPSARAVARAEARSAFWFGHERRYRHLKNALRAVREQIALMAGATGVSPHLERIVGLEETDRGAGLVVGAVRQAHGGLAPTLADLVERGAFDEAAAAQLTIFCDWMIASPIVVNDLNMRNLVYAGRETDFPRFVLVDGYGETAALPLKSWFPALNRRGKIESVARLHRKLERRLAAAEAAKAPRIDAASSDSPLLAPLGPLMGTGASA